jgi:hypothetical protein
MEDRMRRRTLLTGATALAFASRAPVDVVMPTVAEDIDGLAIRNVTVNEGVA